MKLQTGDMWSAWKAADLWLFTSNGVISKKDNTLVMGAGIAKQVRDKMSLESRQALAEEVLKQSSIEGSCYKYGLLVSPRWPKAKLGAFQAKLNFSLPATEELILFSTQKLIEWCRQHPNAQVHLNYPGIGFGKLKEAQVYPIISCLPDTVTVWKYG